MYRIEKLRCTRCLRGKPGKTGQKGGKHRNVKCGPANAQYISSTEKKKEPRPLPSPGIREAVRHSRYLLLPPPSHMQSGSPRKRPVTPFHIRKPDR